MHNTKRLGIWMDHSDAYLMSFTDDTSEIQTISNPFNHAEKEEALNNSESLMHNKNQQHLAAFYDVLGKEIISYDSVVLFGPTDAKKELANVLKADLRFKKVVIAVMQAGKMSDNQKKAFVRDFYTQ